MLFLRHFSIDETSQDENIKTFFFLFVKESPKHSTSVRSSQICHHFLVVFLRNTRLLGESVKRPKHGAAPARQKKKYHRLHLVHKGSKQSVGGICWVHVWKRVDNTRPLTPEVSHIDRIKRIRYNPTKTLHANKKKRKKIKKKKKLCFFFVFHIF